MKVHVLDGPKGKIEIHDVNGDGRYDPGDRILKDKKEVRDPGQARADLKAMGIDLRQLPKLRLQPLTVFLDKMKEAEKLGREGKYQFMEDALVLASRAAEQAGLRLDELKRLRGPDILAGYKAGVEHHMKLAERHARDGDVDGVDGLLKEAERYAMKGAIHFDDERADKIRESVRPANSPAPDDDNVGANKPPEGS